MPCDVKTSTIATFHAPFPPEVALTWVSRHLSLFGVGHDLVLIHHLHILVFNVIAVKPQEKARGVFESSIKLTQACKAAAKRLPPPTPKNWD